jgi:hypothetical protein
VYIYFLKIYIVWKIRIVYFKIVVVGVFFHKILGDEWYWYLFQTFLMYISHHMCVFPIHKTKRHYDFIFLQKNHLEMKREHIFEMKIMFFFPFNFLLCMWHGTKSTCVLMSQNGVKLYVIYDVYVVYTTF